MHEREVTPRRLPRVMEQALCLNDFEPMAERTLPRAIFKYVSGYSEDGATHRRNLRAFAERAFVPNVLVDVSGVDTTTRLFGVDYASPFGIAPMGFSRLVAPDCDVLFARSAAQAGLPFILSGASLTRLEEVRQAGPTSWFQAYIPGDEDRIRPMIERVERAGFDTLVVTVDTAVHGQHELAARHGFRSPVQPSLDLAWQGATRPGWLWRVLLRSLLAGNAPHFENMDAERGPPVFSRTLVRDIGRRAGLSWTHIERIRKRWTGRLVLKGVMSAADARMAEKAGVDGIIVSNHGGRQIDCAAGALDLLERIADQVNGLTVMYDGGVRRGSDVLKALKLGARFVFVGRPLLLAAAAGEKVALDHALSLMKDDIGRTMALLGITRLDEFDKVALIHDGRG
ncbi:alpha-hydroxy acid oxidase [Azospirillum canadense]|uniref:alpha-hydroxy acid oxidase n=1 Tax=Azospirillum canadense TaxID=403962 RepID=UPI002226BDCD|nr:alpha-hydroxy acid oxidase [Azospirillum canadense]MCW2241400.1 L-lactate dehydrogenase (cytochrome) [Azospirillum canadense]